MERKRQEALKPKIICNLHPKTKLEKTKGKEKIINDVKTVGQYLIDRNRSDGPYVR
jgi:hypothetical protein